MPTPYTMVSADAANKPLNDSSVVLEQLANWGIETRPIFDRQMTERTDLQLKALLDKVVKTVPLTRTQILAALYAIVRAPVDAP